MSERDSPEERPSDIAPRSEVHGSASEVVQARDVHGGVHFHDAGRTGWAVPPRQLPADVRGFVNRIADLEALDKILAGDPNEPRTIGLTVIAGTAGVGKTSIAVHWAHRIRGHFPHGQLYANLRGYDPGSPVDPAQVLDHFLRALHVPPSAIPADPDARAALYRSLLADRRILVVLDNAATAAQVRPLVPGTVGCLAIVTSRSRLSGLAFRDGAHRVTLDMLTEPEAVTLLRTVTADYRPEDDAEQLVELARLCARLPLALRIAAERAARRPGIPLDILIQDLRDESGLWDALSVDDEEEADAVRTVFAWSYRALPGEPARVFRLLGLHPGAGFSAAAAASLTATSISQLRHLLDVLVGAHLLEHNAPDRYQFHDLLRVYAADQARQEESAENRELALRRVVSWYLHGADALQAALNPTAPRVSLDPPAADIPSLSFADPTEATNWYTAERANLVAATRAAANARLDRIACQLAIVLRNVFQHLNPFEDWFATSEIGLAAARRLGDRGAEADLLESLAMACVQSHRLAEGVEHYRATVAIRREFGDRRGEAMALNGMGLLHLRRRALAAARSSFEQSLVVFREIGDSYWQALLEGNLGTTYYEAGDLPTALDLLNRVLEVYRERRDPGGQGDALHTLSMIHREFGQPDEAFRAASRAIAVARENGNRAWEGYWLVEFGHVQRTTGEVADALVSYQRAATVQRQLGDRSREAQALDGAGQAYRDLGRYKEAADFHRRAAATHRELNDHWLLALALDNLATATDLAGSANDARRYRRDALVNLAGFDDARAMALRRRISDALDEGVPGSGE